MSKINFDTRSAHLYDTVQLFPVLGMVQGACEALNATGSIYIASGLLVRFLDNKTLDPGFVYECPTYTSPPCTPGPYNITITPELVGAGVVYPEGSIAGVPDTVRALQWSICSHVRSSQAFESFDFIDTDSIYVVHPCIAVVTQCLLPTGRSCFNAGEAVVFTGYVTNCGNINLTNVIANGTQTGRLVFNDPVSGLPLSTNSNGGITLTVGSVATYRDSYVPTLTETCAGTTRQAVNVTGTDTSESGGPNASVTNSASATCSICVVPGLVVNIACPAQPTPPGGTVIFSGTITNTGNITLTNVTVAGNLPAPNTAVFGPVTLVPGAGALFIAGSYTVPVDFCGSFSFPEILTARATTLCGQGITNTAGATCPISLVPGLAISKACPALATPPGGTLIFSGTITNTGAITLTNVTVVDSQPVPNTPVFGPVTLLPGAVASFTGSYTVPVDLCGSSSLSYTLTARATSLCGQVITNMTSATCPISAVPGLAVTKACPAQPTPSGGTLIFSGTITNTGSITLTNVTVVDTQPAPNTLVFGPATLLPGAGVSFTNSYTVPAHFCGWFSDILTAGGTTLCGQGITNTAFATCQVCVGPLVSISMSNRVATIVWTAIPGQKYRVQYQDLCGGTVWSNLTPDIVASAFSATNQDNTLGTAGQRFYRVVTLP
jgi:uncharacterized repeat protein (TIGR01451 family)